MELFTRARRNSTTAFKRKDGTEVNAEVQENDVIIAGRVVKVKEKTTRNGVKCVNLYIAGGTYHDADEVVYYDNSTSDGKEEEIIVSFYDNTNGDNASNVLKLKLGEHIGAFVIVKGQKQESMNDDGTTTVTYFGSRCSYPGCKIELRDHAEFGEGCFVVFGYACISDDKKSISVNVREWDRKAKENFEYWVTLTPDAAENELPEDTVTALDRVEGKCRIAAFLVPRNAFNPTLSGTRATEATATYSAYVVA